MKPFSSHDIPPTLYDLLLFELDPRWSREQKVLAPSSLALPLGSVLAPNNAAELVPYMTELSPAQGENPATFADAPPFVLIQNSPAHNESQRVLVLARCARIRPAALVWGETVSEEQKKNALAALEAHDILGADHAHA